MSDRATVLVVEDERLIADAYADWIADSYDVDVAYSGAEALEKIDETVDVVLLDRRLPEYSGDDVLDEIRALGFDCRVAMVSAVEPDVDVVELDYDTYLVKPISDPEVIRDAVATLLRRSTYDEQMRRLLALSSKQALLEKRLDESEREDSAEFQSLRREVANLRESIDETATGLDDEDLRVEFQRRANAGTERGVCDDD